MPIAPLDGWVMDLDGRMIPSTPQAQPEPADGDDYTYEPRQTHAPPLIPRQWVPVAEYNELVARVTELEERIGRIESHITR